MMTAAEFRECLHTAVNAIPNDAAQMSVVAANGTVHYAGHDGFWHEDLNGMHTLTISFYNPATDHTSDCEKAAACGTPKVAFAEMPDDPRMCYDGEAICPGAAACERPASSICGA
jgi:hypothetical protein